MERIARGCLTAKTCAKYVPYESPYRSMRQRLKRLENGRQIVRGVCRAVERRANAERCAARSHRFHGPFLARLQLGTIERSGVAGAAIVHQEHVAIRTQRREQGEIIVARPGGRVAGTALGRNECTQRFAGRRVRVPFEIDGNAVGDLTGGIERALEPPAVGRHRRAALERESAHAPVIGARRRSRPPRPTRSPQPTRPRSEARAALEAAQSARAKTPKVRLHRCEDIDSSVPAIADLVAELSFKFWKASLRDTRGRGDAQVR